MKKILLIICLVLLAAGFTGRCRLGKRGNEMVTNGTFTGNATGWTLAGELVYSNNAVTIPFTGPQKDGSASQNISGLTANRSYRVVYTILEMSGGTIEVSLSETALTSRTEAGTYTEIIVYDGVNEQFLIGISGTETITIDNVSIRRVNMRWGRL